MLVDVAWNTEQFSIVMWFFVVVVCLVLCLFICCFVLFFSKETALTQVYSNVGRPDSRTVNQCQLISFAKLHTELNKT